MASREVKRDGYAIKRGDQMPDGGYAAYCVCGRLYTEQYFVDCWGECRCPKCRAVRIEYRDNPGKTGPKAWNEGPKSQSTWDEGGD